MPANALIFENQAIRLTEHRKPSKDGDSPRKNLRFGHSVDQNAAPSAKQRAWDSWATLDWNPTI
jgi:hypothetical protein